MAKGKTLVEAKQQDSSGQGITSTLHDEVKQALLVVMRDKSAPAAARTSAARTLLEYYSDHESRGNNKRGAELSIAELDAEIAKLNS